MIVRWIGIVAALLVTALALPATTSPVSFRDCQDGRCPEMVALPAGSFDMGAGAEEQAATGLDPVLAAREGPRHRVAIARSFAVSQDEITVAQWRRFVTATNALILSPAPRTTRPAIAGSRARG